MNTLLGRLSAHPSLHGLVDAGAVLAFVLVGLTAFAGTFDGWAFLISGAVGALVGVLAAAFVARARWPWYAVLPLLVVGFFLVAPFVTLREATVPAYPAPSSWAELGRLSVSGWRELLTTLPPLSAMGPMTVLPFLLALVGAAAGMLVARRSRSSFLPTIGPALATAAAVLLGVAQPGQLLVRALAVAAVAVAWGMARRRRRIESSPGGGLRRAVTAAALVAVAASLAAGAAPVMAQNAGERTILRPHIRPPQDLADQPSPLASFRRFRPVAKDLAEVELLRVSGLPSGAVVRLATLDTYSGSVWAAGNGLPPTAAGVGGLNDANPGFLRVGSRIPVDQPGQEVSATVTIAPAYADNRDLSVWVPTVGRSTQVTFTGSAAPQRQQALRYNPATGAALVTTRLHAGDSYRLSAVLPDPAADTVRATGAVTTPNALTSVTGKLVASTPAGRDRLAQVRAIADRLKTIGAYSDGEGTEATIVPGHSLGRLRAFLAEAEPAGNDEQYAATLALAAGYVGLPSRIVVGAVPDASGIVRGANVRTWVEVEVDHDRWASFAPETLVPPFDKHPKPRNTVEEDRTHAAIVPPPNAQRPPSSLDGFALDDSTSGRQRDAVEQTRWVLPAWLVLTLKIASVPVSALLGWTMLLVGTKGTRRWWRRRQGPAPVRVQASWRDVIDTLRDAGHPVSLTHTRGEVAKAVGGAAVLEAARYADRLAYSADHGTDEDAVQAWSLAARVRTQESAKQTWRRRWLSAVSLRSLFPSLGRVGPAVVPSAVQHDRVVPALSGAGTSPSSDAD